MTSLIVKHKLSTTVSYEEYEENIRKYSKTILPHVSKNIKRLTVDYNTYREVLTFLNSAQYKSSLL